jgi:hypothetical protein
MFAVVAGPVEDACHAVTPERLSANAWTCKLTDELSGSNHAKIDYSF